MASVSVLVLRGAKALIGAASALLLLTLFASAPQAAPEAPAAPAPGAAKAPAASSPPVPIIYLGKQYEDPLPLSYAEEIITDKGIQGARLMIKEANQAGAFVGHTFELVEAIVPQDGDIVAKAKEVLKEGGSFVIADL